MEQTLKQIDLPHLVVTLREQTAGLVRSQVALARAEMGGVARRAVRYAMFMVVGALILAAGLIAAIATAVAVIALFLPVWLSVLVVAAALIVAGLALILRAASKFRHMRWLPVKTIETWKESLRGLIRERQREKI